MSCLSLCGDSGALAEPDKAAHSHCQHDRMPQFTLTNRGCLCSHCTVCCASTGDVSLDPVESTGDIEYLHEEHL